MKIRKIIYDDRARQIIDFDGMQYKDCCGTDCDFMFELDGEMFIFGEFKYNGKEMDEGQRLFFEHVADALTEAGKDALVVILDHYVQNPIDHVDASKGVVREWYSNGSWYGKGEFYSDPGTGLCFREFVDCYLRRVAKENPRVRGKIKWLTCT